MNSNDSKAKPKRTRSKPDQVVQKDVACFFTLDELSSLLEMLERKDVVNFELERGDEKTKANTRKVVLPRATRLKAKFSSQPYHSAPAARTDEPTNREQRTGSDSNGTTAPTLPSPAPSPSDSQASSLSFREITSPMVGTFYRRPSPDAKPYADVGDVVQKGTTLCIVEAMKLMNEIESDISGRIVEVCLEDGQMVEYGEVLFKIDPRA